MTDPADVTKTDWKLVVHGGAGIIERARMQPGQEEAIRSALDRALDAGSAVLSGGGAAMDAAVAAVQVLEEDPHFNSGRGSVFTYEGDIEMDAAVMDGATRDAGAVAGVRGTRSPVALARAVMESSPHVMLSGEGADVFAREQGLEPAGPEYFATDERRRQLDELKANALSWFDVDMKYGTVGAVARDAEGHVAAATSTGGVTGKRWGRIGDSPVIGAGTYADDRAGAVSATGAGEFFIREGVAHEICARMRMLGEGAQAAGDAVLADVKAIGGTGGVILISADGDATWSFNTPGMYRGRADAQGRQIALFGDE